MARDPCARGQSPPRDCSEAQVSSLADRTAPTVHQWACTWQQVCTLPLGLSSLFSPPRTAALLPHSLTVRAPGVALDQAEAIEL